MSRYCGPLCLLGSFEPSCMEIGLPLSGILVAFICATNERESRKALFNGCCIVCYWRGSFQGHFINTQDRRDCILFAVCYGVGSSECGTAGHRKSTGKSQPLRDSLVHAPVFEAAMKGVRLSKQPSYSIICAASTNLEYLVCVVFPDCSYLPLALHSRGSSRTIVRSPKNRNAVTGISIWTIDN